MNIFNKVTLQSLKRSRTRTIVTIIGVILSVAMTTAVTSFIASLQDYFRRAQISSHGEWHVNVSDVQDGFIQKISADDEVKKTAVMQKVGYAKLSENQTSDIPYFFVAGINDTAYEVLPISIDKGRAPTSSEEILIPHNMVDEEKKIDIGYEIPLYIGNRSLEGKTITPDTLYQNNNALINEAETFTHQFTKTYTIVGVYTRPGYSGEEMSEYTIMTKADRQAPNLNIFLELETPGSVYDFGKKIENETGSKVSIGYNEGLLMSMGISEDPGVNDTLYTFGAILILLI
ncbi:MAG: ABC transporter permease, partial [Lachnoclostridium sp.]|nr:ABC transporter permease [Lachnoclostridium sp.]